MQISRIIVFYRNSLASSRRCVMLILYNLQMNMLAACLAVCILLNMHLNAFQ